MAHPNYVAEAFKLKGNLAFVAVGAVASIVLGSSLVFGLFAGAEVFYLWTMSSNPRFRRAIRSRNR